MEESTGSFAVMKLGVALDAVTGALDKLRSATAAEEPLETVLGRLTEAATDVVPDADAVSVTRIDGADSRTVVATDDRAGRLDRQQYEADQGPCLDAARTRQVVRPVVGDHAEQWPEFAAAAAESGIRAYLSVPLTVDGTGPGELVGSFNVYSCRAEAFDPFDEKLMRLLSTAAAAAAISTARRCQAAGETIAQLEVALVSRSEIDQTKGVLMAVHHLTADEAFEHLVQVSQRTNTTLSEVARHLMIAVAHEP